MMYLVYILKSDRESWRENQFVTKSKRFSTMWVAQYNRVLREKKKLYTKFVNEKEDHSGDLYFAWIELEDIIGAVVEKIEVK